MELLKGFLNEKAPELGSAVYEVERLITTTEINVEWMTLNKNEVINWLKSKLSPTTTTTTSAPSPTTSGSSMLGLSIFALIPLGMELITKL